MSGQDGYTIRRGACDPRKLRGKNLAVKPGRTRRYHIPPEAARTIAALLALRAQVIAGVPAAAAPAADTNRRTGQLPTATTKPSASPCRPSSTTSGSPHRRWRRIDNLCRSQKLKFLAPP